MRPGAGAVFPIQWEEPFGSSCSRPWPAAPGRGYPRGSVPQVVEDGVNGVVVDADAGVDELAPGPPRAVAYRRGAVLGPPSGSGSRRALMTEGYETVYRSVTGSATAES